MNLDTHGIFPSLPLSLPSFSSSCFQAMDGFLMVISRDGRILFSSESISNYLGLRQVRSKGIRGVAGVSEKQALVLCVILHMYIAMNIFLYAKLKGMVNRTE